jgi:hypothetical protein
MTILLRCDAPGCGKLAVVPLLNRDGRLPMPEGWWSGTTPERTICACSVACFNAALKAGQQPLRAAETAP